MVGIHLGPNLTGRVIDVKHVAILAKVCIVTTMQDVAEQAGVSSKTVSRVFNDDPHVTEETRTKVRAAMKELNYVPNMLARTFRAGRASVIGIAVPDIGDPFFAAIIRAVDQVAQEHGMAIVVTSLGSDASRERQIIEALLRRQVNGLIVAPIDADQSYLARWLEHLPVVFIDREPTNLSADSFVEDDRGGAREATAHLLERGHERIAFMGDSDHIITTKLRIAGYRDALVDAGLTPDDDLIAMGAGTRAAEIISELLRLPSPPTAIFSSNARTSLGVFPALQSLGRTDIALVSFGDFPMASALQPSVTVLDQNPERLGRAASERLFARINDPDRQLERRNVLAVNLIERASSASPQKATKP
ncbi:MAG: LacI family transcriptional regulator [Leifsonia sp.]|nr:LacI family transcriptional regulator [Leifsonia sp.]MDQ1588109.1 LacI family transcriptional regulator [Microbacteriaceae bacterium]